MHVSWGRIKRQEKIVKYEKWSCFEIYTYICSRIPFMYAYGKNKLHLCFVVYKLIYYSWLCSSHPQSTKKKSFIRTARLRVMHTKRVLHHIKFTLCSLCRHKAVKSSISSSWYGKLLHFMRLNLAIIEYYGVERETYDGASITILFYCYQKTYACHTHPHMFVCAIKNFVLNSKPMFSFTIRIRTEKLILVFLYS